MKSDFAKTKNSKDTASYRKFYNFFLQMLERSSVYLNENR